MPTYRREVRVDAPLEDVWAFATSISGLEAITPGWLGLRVEDVRGPNHGDGGSLAVGTEVRLSVRPFGVGPRRQWVSRITRRERGEDAAVFEDVMTDGPFPTWRHVHEFRAVAGARRSSTGKTGSGRDPRGESTLVSDRVEYELPVVGGMLGPLGWLGFEPMFRERHRRTRRILEDSGAEYQRSE